MRNIDELCSLIKSNPQNIAVIDWAEETDEFDISRMHELILKLNDIDLIDSVIKIIVSEWDLLESMDDPRCYKTMEDGRIDRKFPLRNIYFCEPEYPLDPFVNSSSMMQTIAGTLFLCKREALMKKIPMMKHEKLKAQLIEKYSQTSDGIQEINSTQKYLPAPVKLSFFDSRLYIIAEEQQELRKLLQAEQTNIDTNNGRDWFAFYAAYRYVRKCNSTKKGYVDFFSDIEKLLPGVLLKLNNDKVGDQRYRHYTIQLSKEVDNWYVDNNKLPPINRLVFNDYAFRCTEEMFNKLEIIIRRLFNSFNSLEETLKEKKGISAS